MQLRHELDQLKKMIFGARQERFVGNGADPAQLAMGLESEVVAATSLVNAKKIEYTRSQATMNNPATSHQGRMKLPEHLERKEILVDVDHPEGCRQIGQEITEELEYQPGKLYVNRFVRPKYVSPDNQTILIAPMPERPLPKAIAGPGLLAQIVIDKYVDHLPLHRQQQRFSREKINIPYSTITDWVSNTCKLIIPLYEALAKEVLASDYLHADETPIKVLDKDKKGETHRGYFWVYHNSLRDLVLFDYQPGRGREGPSQLLKDFKGHLQTDGYAAYNIFDQQKDVTLLHCMAHARRKFVEAQLNDAGRAEYALSQFQLLYAIERRAGDQQLSHERVLQLRQEEAVPILEALGKWMQQAYIEVLPKSAIGKALAYSIERWKQLMIYTTDGKLNIDNNPVENAIRPVAVGRKNYLFAGSHEAAQRSALLYSLLGTCKLHGVNPFNWLTYVLEAIPTHPINKIQELLPQKCKAGK
ncbi:MAG TPA: IS66 family transposase [Puia sp.]|uniref:IS66 family transposase n=1 Tax=Puia sp. TaxID=2045100 RepID=UPI002C1B3B30|nr:IS66 family transposase [Puia sp.]HVU97298.1 IS66 family transposase [Puia sp.]